MAKVNTTQALFANSVQSNQALPTYESLVAPSLGKPGRTSKRDRSFRDIIGRAQKRFRGRFGGETLFDERYYRRREAKLAAVAARQRAEQEFTREQLRLVSELAFA